jgi:hypothetical protein
LARSGRLQAIELLIMHGADSSIENDYKLLPNYITVDEECLKRFDLLERDRELYRQELKDKLTDSREEAAELAAERAAEHERAYDLFGFLLFKTLRLPFLLHNRPWTGDERRKIGCI